MSIKGGGIERVKEGQYKERVQPGWRIHPISKQPFHLWELMSCCT